MGKNERDHRWGEEYFADGKNGDYREDSMQQRMFLQENKEQRRFHLQQLDTTTRGDDEGNSLRNTRFLLNNDIDEAEHSHSQHCSELNNIRSVNSESEDNDSFGTGKSETMRSSRKSRRVSVSSFWVSMSVTLLATIFILVTSNVGLVDSCNEAVCASIVSKCTLTQACKCELKNCSCCKECFDCLTYLYDECCSCVELCPKPNISYHVTMHSQVGDLKEPIDDLFRALTEEKDIQGRWATFTYPIDIDQSWFMPKPEAASSANVYTVANGKIIVDPTKEVVTVNCTVAYMSECMPLNKCRNSCHSMGASYFRWFHDGCCECIGSTCINYGIDESRCTKCSMEDDAEDDPLESEAQDDIDNDTTGKEA